MAKNNHSIYISGCMTGKENFNFERFFEIEDIVREMHDGVCMVFNPVEIGFDIVRSRFGIQIGRNNYKEYMDVIKSIAYEDYISADIKTLMICSAVYVFDTWHESRGSIFEVKVALETGKKVYELDPVKRTKTPITMRELGVKISSKPRMELLDMQFVEGIAKVLTYGASKYSDHGYRNVEGGYHKYISALLRHVVALQNGEEFDPETGLPHTYHIGCNAMIIDWFLKNK